MDKEGNVLLFVSFFVFKDEKNNSMFIGKCLLSQ